MDSQIGDRRLDTWLGHNKDDKDETHSLTVWYSALRGELWGLTQQSNDWACRHSSCPPGDVSVENKFHMLSICWLLAVTFLNEDMETFFHAAYFNKKRVCERKCLH